MSLKIAFAGNPNCGKTTLFNRITGAKEYVGNRSGVTVKETVRRVKGEDVFLCDLPGIYSLSPVSGEEKLAVEYIFREMPDGIVNVIDGTNPGRNLYLTIQLLKLKIPLVIAVNMKDELAKRGELPDYEGLEAELGVKVVAVSALTGEGIDSLKNEMKKIKPAPQDKYRNMIEKIKRYEEESESNDLEVVKANAVYSYADGLADSYFHKKSGAGFVAQMADKLFMNKYTSFPVFFLIMLSLFYFTFGIGGGIAKITGNISGRLTEKLFSDSLPSFMAVTAGGLLNGLEMLASFVPLIFILNSGLALLEDSGYLSRVVFVSDYYMRKAGLGGRAVIPLLTGFGCSAAGISSARVIKDKREKIRTALLVPFASCSGKLPVYSMLAASFFKRPAHVMAFIYFLGLAVGFAISLFTGRGEESEPFVLELPRLRRPSLETAIRVGRERTGDFIKKAGLTLIAVAVILSFLSSFDFSLNTTSEEKSMLYIMGNALSPLFAPLGFGNAAAVAAIIAGMGAKEATAVTLGILSGGMKNLPFTPASALSYMTFCLLFVPCLPSFVTLIKETKSVKAAAFSIFIHTAGAYAVSFAVFRICL